MQYLPRVLRYLIPFWPLAVISALVTILSALAGVAAPWPLTFVVDHVLGNNPLPAVLATPLNQFADSKVALLTIAVVAGLLVTLVDNLLHVVSNFVNTKLEQQIVLQFRSDLLKHVQRLSIPYADQVSTGRLMYGINFEASAAGSVILAIQPLAQSALTLIGMVVVSFTIDPLLALLSLTIVPVLYYSVGYYARRIQPWLLQVKGMEADSLSIVHEAMQMLRVIAAFGREGHETRRFVNQASRTVEQRVKLTVRQTLFSLVVNMSTAVGSALVLGFGAYKAMQGEITAGQLLIVLSYVAAVYKPLQAISYTIGSLQDQFVGLEMAYHILDTQPVVADAPDAVSIERAHGHIRYENVSFSYPGRSNTLTDITFEALPGQVVAVVGPTGAGKTTLISLIPRFYEGSAGAVYLDGIDTRKLTLHSLRDQISLVPQEPLLFSGTIADNIRYGRLEATQAEIEAAAQQANAHDFILNLPQQYDTPVGERGVQLSGGERQRICVARAFLRNAPILILDEPTASIDSRTEAVILDALDRLMVGRTTFLIAHRLSTVRHADVILVVNDGRIVERGSHDELCMAGGLYKQLYDLQTGLSHRYKLSSGLADYLEVVADAEAELGPRALAAEYQTMAPAHWEPRRQVTYQVSVQNTGTDAWQAEAADPVRLGVHFGRNSDFPGEDWETDQRFELPHDVAPGETVTFEVDVTAPATPDRYILRHRLVKENVAWFDDLQRTPVVVSHPRVLISERERRLAVSAARDRLAVVDPQSGPGHLDEGVDRDQAFRSERGA